MTQVPSIAERIVDSLVAALESINPEGGYWLDYNVSRFSGMGILKDPPRVVVSTRGADAELEEIHSVRESLSIDLDADIVHDQKRYRDQIDESETDRLIQRAADDLKRCVLQWVFKDADDLELQLDEIHWDRDDGVHGRKEHGFSMFVVVSYLHSSIDPRTRKFDPQELVQ
ncbi:MAG: hypothetical protein KDC95_09810 [Planctomycetes bacterium]|nr:hypothetical protein [Planctomycetota bacterium]